MAKFKLAGARKKSKGTKARGAIPCVIFLISAMALLALLFYSMLKK